jgi:hypothetical protein
VRSVFLFCLCGSVIFGKLSDDKTVLMYMPLFKTTVGLEVNMLDLYCGGAGFESWPGHYLY